MQDSNQAKAAGRKERLAAQLRENLKKRKAQGRARRDAPGAVEASEPMPAGLARSKPVG